jgi:hypothetical protein
MCACLQRRDHTSPIAPLKGRASAAVCAAGAILCRRCSSPVVLPRKRRVYAGTSLYFLLVRLRSNMKNARVAPISHRCAVRSERPSCSLPPLLPDHRCCAASPASSPTFVARSSSAPMFLIQFLSPSLYLHYFSDFYSCGAPCIPTNEVGSNGGNLIRLGV